MNETHTKNPSSQIVIFDTTLRDGEQSPGATMSLQEKIAVATRLDAMGVNVIEAGFAASSQGDAECIKAVSKAVTQASICSLARAIKGDIDAAARSLEHAKKPRIHTFVSTSDIHIEHQLRKTREEVLTIIDETVRYAKSFCDDVEWSAMDATRSDITFLSKAVDTAIRAGAKTINIPDTVGYAVPAEYLALIGALSKQFPSVCFSTHCHNDLGLAVANSLAGVTAGARQIECTINGIGERAGNAAMEEIVMAIKTREDYFHCHTNIDTRQIYPTARFVAAITGFPIQKNKAIVGANAFAHESGIH
ncbi:MAG: 2-isopropylmalate synthase, partial [Alphaproteobacteria bacterium]